MKIIKNGKFNETLFRGICEQCSCEVECNRNEVVYDKNDVDYPWSVECPECKYTINLYKV